MAAANKRTLHCFQLLCAILPKTLFRPRAITVARTSWAPRRTHKRTHKTLVVALLVAGQQAVIFGCRMPQTKTSSNNLLGLRLIKINVHREFDISLSPFVVCACVVMWRGKTVIRNPIIIANVYVYIYAPLHKVNKSQCD